MASGSCVIEKKNNSTIEQRLSAAKKLSGGAFKLYNYIDAFPIGKETFARSEASEATGLARPTVVSAFNELCEKNFLQKKDDFHYEFFCES